MQFRFAAQRRLQREVWNVNNGEHQPASAIASSPPTLSIEPRRRASVTFN